MTALFPRMLALCGLALISFSNLSLAKGHQGPWYTGEDRTDYVGNSRSFYPQFPGESSAPADTTAAIEMLIQNFASRWTAKSWTTVLELWDRNEASPYLLLAHQPDWLVGWDELDGYFNRKQTFPVKHVPKQASGGIQQIEPNHYEYRVESELKAMLYTVDRVVVRQISDELAVAAWYVDFQYKPQFTPAKGEHFKANAMFRKTADGWKFIHYGEAAMSAIMYMERLYRTQASPEFIESLKSPRK